MEPIAVALPPPPQDILRALCYTYRMSRTVRTEAVVLAVRAQGEHNRTVTLLSPDDGVQYATLYGGAKSRLRSLVSPFNRGRVWLYRDEVRGSLKITDFDAYCYHLSFRENLFKSWAAALAAETVIQTRCAGSPDECWRLVNGFLDGMELSSEDASRAGLIRFIWRYLALLGVQPRIDCCARCGAPLLCDKDEQRTVYSEADSGFVCASCATTQDNAALALKKRALTYLAAVSDLAPNVVRAIGMDGETMAELKALCYRLLENAAGTRLATLRSGIGIL